MNLHSILLNRAKKQELAHFYIVESSAPFEEAQKLLVDFAHQFIKSYYQEVEGHKQSMIHLMDHPDVYVLGNLPQTEKKETTSFKVEEAEAFSRFFEFRAVQSKRKFAVITEAHRVTNIVANKWLKLFEEPQGESTIFLLNPTRQKLLDTIHSRAIHLRLPKKERLADTREWDEFLSSAKTFGLSEFLETFSRDERDLRFWMDELIRWESEQHAQAASKIALESWIKTYQEMEIFHQPTATKWTLFYHHLKEHVLPRLSVMG